MNEALKEVKTKTTFKVRLSRDGMPSIGARASDWAVRLCREPPSFSFVWGRESRPRHLSVRHSCGLWTPDSTPFVPLYLHPAPCTLDPVYSLTVLAHSMYSYTRHPTLYILKSLNNTKKLRTKTLNPEPW